MGGTCEKLQTSSCRLCQCGCLPLRPLHHALVLCQCLNQHQAEVQWSITKTPPLLVSPGIGQRSSSGVVKQTPCQFTWAHAPIDFQLNFNSSLQPLCKQPQRLPLPMSQQHAAQPQSQGSGGAVSRFFARFNILQQRSHMLHAYSSSITALKP